MSLNCGNNVSLDALNGMRDEIKTALSQGKAGLATMQAKAAEAVAKLNEIKVPLPSVALPSLQEDLNTLITNATADLNIASISLPTHIETFKTTWGSVLSDTELQGYIDQATSLVNGAISSGGLSGFDPCKLFPNKEIKDGKVDTKAKKAETPNTNATEPEESAATLDTVAEVLAKQASELPSVVSPSGLTYMTVYTEYMAIAVPNDIDIQSYFTAEHKSARDALDAHEKSNASTLDGLINSSRNAGMKMRQLYESNQTSETEAKFLEKLWELQDASAFVDTRKAIFHEMDKSHRKYLIGEIDKEDFDNREAGYLGGNIDGHEIPTQDYSKYVTIKAKWEAGKTALINWHKYSTENGPR
tara:strand:+ start:7037 stop:8113 length:1077 start_codon:yes stop_codon:yes gene_type:complete